MITHIQPGGGTKDDSARGRPNVLPLGISFFTFTQIAFLVDAYRGEVKEPNFIHYGLFVTYFPYLIAKLVPARDS